ncbi:Aldo/keto reductase [Polychaeton citri CBS 116435]|uniref:Aldo/keto reductase n=1 Tax=Polychaeton citri CBS 116435 TaxID=1314669 RepID=A0A9P4UQN9_9PEZI|nr:Aldo/keto reductase [Polychaeton citri CBS 116435]
MAGIKNVFGGAGANPDQYFGEPDNLQKAFDLLEKYNTKTIDTATLYGESQAILGKAGAGKRFTIDTKATGGFGGADRANVLKEAKESKEQLNSDVDVYYLHAPDYKVPIEETLEAINEVYKSGFFKRFGLSNYKVEDVQKIYDVAKEKGFVLPSVYQGNYNAVARLYESDLFPTLRKLGISFYAYSPIAGGFLTKTKQDILDGKGRFDTSTFLGQMYAKLYSKPSYLSALSDWSDIATEEGTTQADLAYRWVKYNSPLKAEHGDAIIIGARNLEQLEETLKAIDKGPLSEKAARRIDGVWEKIKGDAPIDNYHSYFEDKKE